MTDNKKIAELIEKLISTDNRNLTCKETAKLPKGTLLTYEEVVQLPMDIKLQYAWTNYCTEWTGEYIPFEEYAEMTISAGEEMAESPDWDFNSLDEYINCLVYSIHHNILGTPYSWV